MEVIDIVNKLAGAACCAKVKGQSSVAYLLDMHGEKLRGRPASSPRATVIGGGSIRSLGTVVEGATCVIGTGASFPPKVGD